jgi:sugar phosphate isomerase/epimerase
MVKRRDFLTGAAAALTAPWLATKGAGIASAATLPPPEFHLGCVTHQIFAEYDLESIIKILESANFEGVELRTTEDEPGGHAVGPKGQKHGVEPTLNQAARARVRKRFEASKIRLVGLGSVCEFQSADPAERRRQVAKCKQFIDLAHDVGAEEVKVRPYGWGTEPDHQKTTHHIGECLHEVGEYALPKNVQIWLEFHDEGHQADQQMMEIANLPNVGLNWNSADADIVGGSLKPTWDMLGKWVRVAHCHDPQARDYPYPELFNLMRASHYTGWTHYEGPARGDIPQFLKDYKAWWVKTTRA